mgnify:CR=1 FL=1
MIYMGAGERFREVFKKSYLSRGVHRTTKRSISDAVKLGLIAKELINCYMSVVEWGGFKRVIRVDLDTGNT